MPKIRLFFVVLLWSLPLSATWGQFAEWKHRGTLVLLTTPDGADLPADASEEGFPVLVRLNGETFDFRQARPDGADLRFSADGRPLAYQIEQWDAAAGEAAVWVRIPQIRGNARQELALHWGNPDATSESSGPAVFNDSNGYCVVMHLGDAAGPVRDEVGSVVPVAKGTTTCPAPSAPAGSSSSAKESPAARRSAACRRVRGPALPKPGSRQIKSMASSSAGGTSRRKAKWSWESAVRLTSAWIATSRVPMSRATAGCRCPNGSTWCIATAKATRGST